MTYGWWLLQIILTLTALFFTVFGIDLLIGAYSLGDPFSFIMTFFAASLIILISMTLLAGFVMRMVRTFKHSDTN